MLKNILGFFIILGFATLWIYFLYLVSGPDERLMFPTKLSEIRFLSKLLELYAEEHSLYTFILFSSVYLYKQAFAIPGSVFLNLLAGAVLGPVDGFILCSILSAFGATFCFLLSKYITYALVERFSPNKLRQFQDLVAAKRSSLFYFLLSLRLFPMTPNWLLNMSSPLARVPLIQFFFSVLIGLAPYNFLTVQAGSVVSDINSMDDIISAKVLFSLTLLAAAMMGPAIVKKRIKSKHDSDISTDTCRHLS